MEKLIDNAETIIELGTNHCSGNDSFSSQNAQIS